MYKVAVMGDWDSIYGFAALGMDTFRIDGKDTAEAGKTLRKLAESEYAIIYMTEALAAQMQEEIAQYRAALQPAIILIPGIAGNTGEGKASVRRSVEQAVGTDIFAEKPSAGKQVEENNEQ